MRRELIVAALALAAGAAQADCTVVFGQARNPRLLGGPNWDDINKRFNMAVADTLQAGGLNTRPMSASSADTDVQAVGRTLLKQADKLGCSALVETTVFADEQGTLVLRLRAYPLLPLIGAGGTVEGLRIGEQRFVTQRDLPPAALLRMDSDALAAQMAAEYLQRERR